jgi:hypothetical protein
MRYMTRRRILTTSRETTTPQNKLQQAMEMLILRMNLGSVKPIMVRRSPR